MLQNILPFHDNYKKVLQKVRKNITVSRIQTGQLRGEITLPTLLILIAEGAPGKPGRQVLKAEISLNCPRPHALMPDTRNLYAVPGSNSCRFKMLWSGTLTTSISWNRQETYKYYIHFNLEMLYVYVVVAT